MLKENLFLIYFYSLPQNASGPTPDIGLNGELVVGQTLWCGPLDGELGSSVSCVGVSCH